MLKKFKPLLFFLFIIVVSLFVFFPSFNLALTGDDYLSLWRYHYFLDQQAGVHDWINLKTNWNNISFFLTDYGPQDTFITIIYNVFGDQPTINYLCSFILRMTAALSFFPLLYYLTKNKIAAYYAVLFFAITTTGLETTNWSFNMPSYVAIAMMNIFFLTYIKSREKKSHKLFLISALLFYLTIIVQPIRMVFLLPCTILLSLYLLFRNKTKKILKTTIFHIGIFLCIVGVIYTTGYLGNSIGAGETFNERITSGWMKVFMNNFANLFPYLINGQYQLLTYPIAIFGSLIFPTNIIPAGYEPLTPLKALIKISLPLYFFLLCALLFFFKKKKIFQIKNLLLPLFLATLWSIYAYLTFSGIFILPLPKSRFITMILGGYLLLGLLFFFIRKYREAPIALGIILGTLISFLSFVAPWLRSPTFLYASAERYMIVPVAGVTILLGVCIASVKNYNRKLVVYGSFVLLILLHMYTTFTYLSHLSTVRGIELTQSVRKSVPYLQGFRDLRNPVIVYFEPKNSEILYHSLLFGFPVIMGYQYNFSNVWHIAYSEDWQEIVAAYKDGSSLKRFSIPVKKVPLDAIYSFRLDGEQLINTSEETRNKLKNENINN